MIGLSKELPENEEKYSLHRLLGALVSEELAADRKLDIIETEYGIPVEEDMRKDVNEMCNLGEGLVERTKKRVTEQVTEKIIVNMHEKGYTIEQISDVAEKSPGEVKTIIERVEKREAVLA